MTSIRPSPRGGDPGPRRVVVVSEHSLVKDSVRAALVARGLEPVESGVVPLPDVGLLLSDLDSAGRVRRAQLQVSGLPVPWLVLAGSPRGAAWGALYERGVALIVPASTGLDQVCRLLEHVRAGRRLPSSRKRRELIEAWRDFERRQLDLRTRVDSLTARERQVLRQLHAGTNVNAIAEEAHVKEATVRSQVKAILKKLDVNSQLAAVRVFESLRSELVR